MTARYLLKTIAALCAVLAISACGRNDPSAFIASAQSYLAKSEFQAAIIELKNALNKSPDNAQARFLLAKALLDSGAAGAAETEVRKAIELKYPADEVMPVLAWSLVGQGEYKKAISETSGLTLQSPQARAEVGAAIGTAQLALGQTKEARTAITAALAAQPTNVKARIAEVRLAATDNDVPGALKLVDAVLATSPAAPNNVEALALKADLEIMLSRREDAIKTLEEVVAAAPNFLPARYTLVANLVQAKQIDRAAKETDALKKIAPNSYRTLYSEALVEFSRGKSDGALDAAQKSLQVAPDYLPARYLAGIIYYQRGSYNDAEDAMRMVVAKAPEDDGARRVLAATYLRRGQATKALEALEPALRRAPADPELLRLAGDVSLALNQPDKAAEYHERAIALGGNDISGRVRLAQVRLASGDAGQGLHDLEALMASEPTQTEPALALISAHLKRGELNKALTAAKALVASQPGSALAHNTLGVVHLANRDTKSGRAEFEKALSLDANFVAATYNLAMLDIAEHDIQSARKRYEQVLAKDPSSVQVLLGLAKILMLSNAPQDEIDKAIRRAVAADPGSTVSRLTLIRFYVSNQNLKAALAAAREADAAIPNSPQILDALGAVEAAAGETNQAIETFRRLAKLQPSNPSPLARAAEVQVRVNDFAGAIVSLRGALAVAPDDSGVWVALAGLYVKAGQAEAGIAEARKIQKDRPTSGVGFALEGELLARQGKMPEAAAAFRASLARQQAAVPVIRLYDVLIAMAKPDEAAALAQKWLKDHPKDVLVRIFLGQQRLASKDYKGAALQFRAALANEPENVAILNNLAWAMSEAGDAGALELAERAYRLAPNSAEVANTYGWILVKRGDTARGIELLRKAVALAPTDGGKRVLLARGLIKAGDKAAAKTELEAVVSAGSSTSQAEAEQLLKEL